MSARIRKPAEKAAARKCPRCSETVVQPETGRRRVYCSESCRRATEYELRRLDAAIRWADKQATAARAKRAIARKPEDVAAAQALFEFWADESEELATQLEDELARSEGEVSL
jgi:predicted nucleic acid-binding Zn ribbon protein